MEESSSFHFTLLEESCSNLFIEIDLACIVDDNKWPLATPRPIYPLLKYLHIYRHISICVPIATAIQQEGICLSFSFIFIYFFFFIFGFPQYGDVDARGSEKVFE